MVYRAFKRRDLCIQESKPLLCSICVQQIEMRIDLESLFEFIARLLWLAHALSNHACMKK